MRSIKKDTSELFTSLKQKGFSDEIINRAIQRSPTLDEETIIDCIEELLKNPGLMKEEDKIRQEMLEDIKQRKVEQQKDKEYLERVRERIAESRRDVKTIEINEAVVNERPVYGECTIKVRFDDQSVIFQLKKDDKVKVLFDKIEKRFGINGFKVFITNPTKEIIVSEESMEDLGLVPTGMVMINK